MQGNGEMEANVCPVCLESMDIESAEMVRLPCNHSFCLECLETHCELNILVSKRIPIPCPCHGESCKSMLQDSVVKRVLLGCEQEDEQRQVTCSRNSTEWILWKRYVKAIQLAKDPSLLVCPRCDEIVPPSTTSLALIKSERSKLVNTNSAISCSSCQHVFCQVHGDLHSPLKETCAEYEQSEQARQIKQSERTLKQYCKPCSRCGSHISKESGCDHVVCPACGDDMCFKCGTHLYLTGTAVRHCHKCSQGYLDHRYDHVHRTRVCAALPFVAPFYIAYMLIMAAVAVVTGFFCCCCGCKAHLDSDVPDQRTPKRAIQLGFYAVILPILFLMNDFGFHTDFVDQATQPEGSLPDEQRMPEIPVMTMNEEDDEILVAANC